MQNEDIKSLIMTGIPGCVVEVNGDGTHFEAIIISEEFSGKTKVQQHQLVYGTLGKKMGNEIHALSIQTFTPDQWDQQKGLKIL